MARQVLKQNKAELTKQKGICFLCTYFIIIIGYGAPCSSCVDLTCVCSSHSSSRCISQHASA
jgi:hypothetical protein